jgi:hypothetical protein
MQLRIIGIKEKCHILGISVSGCYQKISEGLLPKGFDSPKRVNSLPRSSGGKTNQLESTRGKNGWHEHEAQLMALAKVRGDSDEQQRALVANIEEMRNQSYNDMRAWYELRFSESRREVAA